MELLIILFMLALSAFFSGSEIAFVAANRLRVEVAARQQGMIGRVVSGFLENPASFLTTTLVGNNIALVVYSTLIAFYLDPPLDNLWTRVIANESGVDVAVLITQTVIASFIVLIVGEILPKTIMREVANQAVFILALPLRATYFLLLPLVKLSSWTSSLLIRLIRADAATLSQFIRRDFEIIIQEGMAAGEIDLDEEGGELLSNVFALGSIRVKESMVPRPDVIAVEENMSLEDVRKRFIETGHSKLPVYRDNIDSIVGMAFAYDLFQQPESLHTMMRPVNFVPESKLSKDLLQEFLATTTSVAIVIDEYGGTAGLVTREDLLEELFGDIQDEFDTEAAILRQINEHTFVTSGRVKIDDLTERYRLHLPPGDYDTVAGYLLNRLGTIPAPKEEHVFDGCRFTILQATSKRIDLVRIVRQEG